jgi:hypothetical protein
MHVPNGRCHGARNPAGPPACSPRRCQEGPASKAKVSRRGSGMPPRRLAPIGASAPSSTGLGSRIMACRAAAANRGDHSPSPALASTVSNSLRVDHIGCLSGGDALITPISYRPNGGSHVAERLVIGPRSPIWHVWFRGECRMVSGRGQGPKKMTRMTLCGHIRHSKGRTSIDRTSLGSMDRGDANTGLYGLPRGRGASLASVSRLSSARH